jgi:O-antigen/teichoic acid export membrane protein
VPSGGGVVPEAAAAEPNADDSGDHLIRGSAWLLATVGANALSGLVFWLVAFRLDTASDVGRATALFTSVQFVNYLTSMGLPVALARYAPDRTRTSRALFGWALLITTISSLVGTLGFALLGPDRLLDVLSQWGTPLGIVLFCSLVIGMSFAVLVEVRLMTLRRWGWVLARVALVGVARVPLLFIRPFDGDALWLAVLAAGGPAASGYIGAAVLQLRSGAARALRPVPEVASAAMRYAGVNYLGLLAAQGPQFALPVIVLLNVTPAQNAAYYVAWGITTIVFLIPHTVGQVLLVEGGRDGADLNHQVHLTLVVSVSVMAAIALVGWALPDLITLVYGDSAEAAVAVLPGFLVAGVAWAITSAYLARARVLEDSVGVVLITGTFAVATLVPALSLVPADGLSGAGRAWLFGNMAAAAVAVLVGRRQRPLVAHRADA